MKKAFLITLILILALSSVVNSQMRDVKAIGIRAVRSGRISAPPDDHDFTKIPPGAEYKPGELLVRFESKENGDWPSIQEKKELLTSLGGGTLQRNYDIVPGLTLVRLPPNVKVEDALKEYNKKRGILYAELNYIGDATLAIPNDTRFSKLWGMHNTGQTGGTAGADVNAPEAWDIATGSKKIVVAVIDSGVNYNHEDLADNMWTDGNGYHGYDYLSNDNYPMDCSGHGTHCAGTVGAIGNNEKGVVGVCWNVNIMAVRWIDCGGSGSTSDAIDSIEYATEMSARVMSNSWKKPSPYAYHQGLKDAIDAAGEAGILFVAAAGNDNNDNDEYPLYPASYDCDNIIAVLAMTHDDTKWSSSSYGQTSVDLGAPGSSIYSCTHPSGYGYMNGTSMATPHVAGACALLLSINPSLTAEEVKDIIMDNVYVLGSLDDLCVSEGRLDVSGAVNDSRTWENLHARFRAVNGSNEIAGWVDEWGNVILTGSLEEEETLWPQNVRGIKLRNQSGGIAAMMNCSTGNLHIAGTCSEYQDSLDPPSTSRFIIKDSDGNVVAYIDNSGNLCLKGRVYEQI